MFTNANKNMEIGLSQMTTMNDDQGTLLDNGEAIKDDYILSYRFEIEYIYFFDDEIYFLYLDIDNLINAFNVFVYVIYFYLQFY
jgi:hypothetical protein